MAASDSAPHADQHDDIVFAEELTGGDLTANPSGPLVLKFYSDGCFDCRVFAPVFDRVAARLQDSGALFAKVDVAVARTAAARHNVRKLPTLVVISNGVEVLRYEELKENRLSKRSDEELAAEIRQRLTAIRRLKPEVQP